MKKKTNCFFSYRGYTIIPVRPPLTEHSIIAHFE